MIRSVELGANVANAVSILLAGCNSIHTWWTGIAGCILFSFVFFNARLYADLTLQVFFVATSIAGWYAWLQGNEGQQRPVRRTPRLAILSLMLLGGCIAGGYGWLLHQFTDAYAPFIDSTVLAFSVLGQFLLMGRRFESWWCWLLVNTIAVPLYLSRGLFITALLYAGFWVNSVVALKRWRQLIATT